VSLHCLVFALGMPQGQAPWPDSRHFHCSQLQLTKPYWFYLYVWLGLTTHLFTTIRYCMMNVVQLNNMIIAIAHQTALYHPKCTD